MNFNLNQYDLDLVDQKLSKQKEFLKNFVLEINGKEFSLLDNVPSANLNPKKYYAEANNRVNALFKYAQFLGMRAVFITITLPSEYHPSSHCFNGSSPQQSALELSRLWRAFLDRDIFRRMKKSTGRKMIYFRTYEPHKSGVPHLHAMIFLPKNYILPVKKVFNKNFGNVQKQYKYTFTGGMAGAVSYIMKYINKTFKNALTGVMTLEAYWFARWSIRRFLTSRTLIPLKFYRRINYLSQYQDLIVVTKLFKGGLLGSYFDDTCLMCIEFDDEGNDFDRVLYLRSNQIDDQVKHLQLSKTAYDIPKSIKRRKNYYIPLVINGHDYLYYNDGRIVDKNSIISFSRMSNYTLFSTFQQFENDFDVDPKRYGCCKNEMIKRNLIDGSVYSLNDYGYDLFV